MSPGPDEIDIWGMNWARQRRMILGIIPGKYITLQERLGKMRCTLAQVRETDRSEQTALNGHPNQDWPEVYVGLSMVVHRIYSLMPGPHREVMNLHYVYQGIPARPKAAVIGVSLPQYWIRVGMMKSFLYGAVAVDHDGNRAIASKSSRRFGEVVSAPPSTQDRIFPRSVVHEDGPP